MCSLKNILNLEENIKSAEDIKREKKAKASQYYKEFKKKHPDYYKEKNKKSKLENFEKALFFQTRSIARRKKIEFTLEITDIIIPVKCPLTEIKITKSVGEGKVASNPFVYRKDESIGYTKDNVIVTCVLANNLRSIDPRAIVAYAKIILNELG